MGSFKLKVNLTYKEAVSLVLGGKPNQYGMRRHDEYHAMTGRCTEYLTKLNEGLWRVTGKDDKKGDRKGVVLKGKDVKWYVFQLLHRPEKVACYLKYLKAGGVPIKKMDKLLPAKQLEKQQKTNAAQPAKQLEKQQKTNAAQPAKKATKTKIRKTGQQAKKDKNPPDLEDLGLLLD